VGMPRFNPFPGLRPFEPSETHLFFGRQAETREVIRRLGRGRFLAVVGTSGSGKSSLVRAGLLPALEGGLMAGSGSRWRVAIMRPSDDPIGNLARSLASANTAASELGGKHGIQEALAEATLRSSSLGLSEYGRQLLGSRDIGRGQTGKGHLLVVVDQFEELFTLSRSARSGEKSDDAALFVRLLLDAAGVSDERVYVLLTMRSDFLGQCSQFHGLPEALNDRQYLVPRMSREEQREAVTGPVAVAGGEIAEPLVNQLLNDAGDNPDQLPILQHALMRAWDHWIAHRNNGEPLDLSHYREVGGMLQALSRHADEAYEELDQDGQEIAQRVFKRLTKRGPDNQDVRDPARLGELCQVVGADQAAVERVVNAFRKKGRSFVLPPDTVSLNSDSLIDISHESLIRNWARLKEWADEEAESARIYTRLAETAVLHSLKKESLYRDPALQNAIYWQEHNRPNAAWARRYHADYEGAMEFLRNSADSRDREGRQKEEQRRRQVRWLWLFLFGLATALVASLALVRYAFQQRNKATEQTAETERLSYVTNIRAADQAEQSGDFSLANGFLGSCIPKAGERDLRGFDWDYLSHHTIFSVTVTSILEVRFSPDGGRIVTAGADNVARVWDARSGQQLIALEGHSGRVFSVAYSPDGKNIVTASSDKTAKVWDAQSGQELITLRGHSGPVYSVAYSPDGKRIVTASADHTAKVWDAQSGQELITLKGHLDLVTSVAYSPDGERIVTASFDHTAKVWDGQSGQELIALKGHSDSVDSVAYSPDGERIVTASFDHTAKVWDAQSGQELITLKGHSDSVDSVAYSPDGKRIVTASADHTAKVWDAQSGQELITLKGHLDLVTSVAYSPDGERIVTASFDHTAKVWDGQFGQELITLKGHLKGVTSVAFSPDGKRIVTGSRDGAAKVWDAISGSELITIAGHLGGVTSVAYSPDGKRIVTGSFDATAKVWDTSWGARE
jgi:WD40 repeat protein/energy-coupling factor transporter ATP-binding protein EcfA2